METLTPQQISGRLTAALATIRDLWEDMNHPTYGSMGPKAGSGDMARIERIANVSREITDDLFVWSKIMLERINPDVRVPGRYDALGMVAYLLAGIEDYAYLAHAFEDMQKAERHAAAIRSLVYGSPAPDLALCPCPFDCAGTVRATPLRDDEGRDLARCDACSELHPVAEWQRLWHIEERKPLTKAEMVALARQQFGITLTEHGITCLVSRGILAPIDATKRPQTFELEQCVSYLTRRLSAA